MRNRGIVAGILFWLNLLMSLLLGGLVLVAPRFVAEDPSARGWLEVLVLFGHDSAVRRVGLAASIGLMVTACVCFWPSRGRRPRRSTRRRIRSVAGA